MRWFRNLICYLIFDLKWKWLEKLINSLCAVEMFIDWVDLCTAERKVSINFGKIPEGMYCYSDGKTCPYWSFSYIAKFFYGYQSAGYCHYLKEGDFNSSTMILWDQCKCCDINDDIECDEEDIVECNLEL